MLPLIYLCSMLLQHTLLYEKYFKFYSEGLSLKLHITYISHIFIPFRMILQTTLWCGKTDITVRNSLHKNITVKPNFCIFSFVHKHVPEMKEMLLFLTMLILHYVVTKPWNWLQYGYTEKMCKEIWEFWQYILQW